MLHQDYKASIAGAFTGTGVSAWVTLRGTFSLALWGTAVATVQLEATFDGGTTVIPVSRDALGTPAVFASTSAFAVKVVGDEPEQGIQYRVNCTAYTSGTANYRLSQ